ncbi:MAG TPA: hypothetical protein VHU79_05885 [Sphingomicrobium sp.]|jgi:hypothetical protein|nr:hypothetical protein [Sphingomicrobium sp.]
MPQRRRVKKNSFGSHFDDLVKHFPEHLSRAKGTDESAPKEERNIHDRLFETAWRHKGVKSPEA